MNAWVFLPKIVGPGVRALEGFVLPVERFSKEPLFWDIELAIAVYD